MADNFFAPSPEDFYKGRGLNPQNPAGTYVDLAGQVQNMVSNQQALQNAIQNARIAQAAEGRAASMAPLAEEASRAGSEATRTRTALSQMTKDQANKTLKAQVTIALGKLPEKDPISTAINSTFPEGNMEMVSNDVVENFATAIRAMVAERKAAAGVKAPKSVGQEAIDRKFGTEYAQFYAAGGYADIQKQLAQLKEAANYLRSPAGADATGPTVGKIPDRIRSFTAEGRAAIDVREKVEEVAQRSLRAVLGGQFAEKEGDKLVKRAFNPELYPADNAQRIDRLIQQIDTAARAKAAAGKYMDENGTLKGFEGGDPLAALSLSGEAPALEAPAAPKAPGSSAPSGVEDFLGKYNL